MQNFFLFDVFAPLINFIFIRDTGCRVLGTYDFIYIELCPMISFAPLFDLITVRFKYYYFRSSLILSLSRLYAQLTKLIASKSN